MTKFFDKKYPKIIGIIVVAFFLIALPIFNPSNYIYSVAVMFAAFAAFGTCWNIIGGYASQICWCHATFVAIGSYTSVLLFRHFGISPWISMIPAAAISALVAIIIGSISLRLRGVFFSLTTIAFCEGFKAWLNYQKNLTNGSSGLVVTFKGESLRNLMFRTPKGYYYVFLVMLVVCIIISWRIQRSKMGFYLRAIKADEDAAMSLGIATHKVKLKAFVISALMTTCLGVVYGFYLSYIDPTAVASSDLSTKIGTMALVGGAGTLAGPIFGAALLIPLAQIANILLGSSGAGMLIYGLALVLVMLFRPKGVRSFFVSDDGYTNIKVNDGGLKWKKFSK